MRFLLAALSFFFVPSAFAAQQAAPEAAEVQTTKDEASPAPAMWIMSDADTTLYLLGTIHTLPDEYDWRTDTLDEAITASDALMVETRLSTLNPIKLLAVMGRTAIDRTLPPVRERIDPELVDDFERALEVGLFPERGLDNLESWAVALLMVATGEDDPTVSGENGVEENLEEWFEEQGKPIAGLETIEQGLGFLDKMSAETQIAFLNGMISDGQDEDGADPYMALLDIWARGDLEGIADLDWGDDEHAREFIEIILYERNANWVEWIKDRMESPGSVMVAVGAAHFAGERSVVDMLEKEGWTLTRIQ